MSTPRVRREVSIRVAVPEDAPVCGRICYDAFHTLNTAHNVPPDLPAPEAAIQVLTMMFSHPSFYCVLAELDGRIVGSNCLDERSSISGIGPITIDPSVQNSGIGRKLMQAVIDRAHERGAPGVRLVQSAFHNRSLSLYASMGFDVRESLACMAGSLRQRQIDGFAVRTARTSDADACNGICFRMHGHDRAGELADGIQQGSALVVERNGQVTGYTSAMSFFGHTVAETDLGLEALIASVESVGGPGILVPTRNSTLFRWCLANGLRVVYSMNLMTLGLYNEPAGAHLPSILF